MSLRVRGGLAKGRALKSVPGEGTRPVTDIVKQALFNILADDVVASSWWDLFAGTGAIGIEALSRGAAFVRFSDSNRLAIETVRWNLNHCKLSERAEVRRGNAFTMLAASPDRSFDYIYIAPPQYQELWARAMLSLDANPDWLVEDGWAIVQIHPREYRRLALQHFTEIEQRKYGSTLLVFYERLA